MIKTVLVTGAGGGSGMSAIRLLKRTSSCSIIAADCNIDSPGFEFADKKLLIPRASSSSFIDTIAFIVDQYNVDIVLPNVDEELPIFSKNTEKISNVFISPFETIQICDDKRETVTR